MANTKRLRLVLSPLMTNRTARSAGTGIRPWRASSAYIAEADALWNQPHARQNHPGNHDALRSVTTSRAAPVSRGIGPPRDRVRPRHRPAPTAGRLRLPRRDRARHPGGRRRRAGLGRHAAPAAGPRPVPLQGTHRAAPGRAGRADHRRARQGPGRCPGRSHPRPRGGRVRLRHSPPAQGRVQRERGLRRGQLVPAPAGRRVRRHHAIQFSRDGAALDVSRRHRLRQHLRAEALGEGSVLPVAPGRTADGSRPAARRAQRDQRRPGSRGHAAHPPAGRRRQLRGLDARGRARLPDRGGARQARAGARRREEPHGRPAGRRHGTGGQRTHGRRLRFGGRTVHGHLGGRRRGRCGRPAGQGAAAKAGGAEDRAGHGRRGHGAAGHRRAPGSRARLHRHGRQRGRDAGGGRARGRGFPGAKAASSSAHRSSIT